MKKENEYQASLVRKIKERFPGSMVLKNDPNYIQGIPDLLVLYKKRWAALEVKRNEEAPHRPNQEFYIQRMNRMSYASFVYPENEEEVFHGLQQAFQPKRPARVSEPEQVALAELHGRAAGEELEQQHGSGAGDKAS